MRTPWIGALALLLLTHAVFAQGGAATAGITPDSFLWTFDRAAEGAALLFTFDDTALAEKRIAYAQERLDEAQAMAEENNIDALAKAQQAHAGELAELESSVRSIKSDSAAEELQMKAKLQQAISTQREQIIQIQNKIEIRVKGELTPTQQAKLDALLESFAEETTATQDQLETEKEKARLKVKATESQAVPAVEELKIKKSTTEGTYTSATYTCSNGESIVETTASNTEQPECQPYNYWKKHGVQWCEQQQSELINLKLGSACTVQVPTPPTAPILDVKLGQIFTLHTGQQANLIDSHAAAVYLESIRQPCAIPLSADTPQRYDCGALARVTLSAKREERETKLAPGESLEVAGVALLYYGSDGSAGKFQFRVKIDDGGITPLTPDTTPVEPQPALAGFTAATYTCSNGLSLVEDARSCVAYEVWKDRGVQGCAHGGAELIEIKTDGPCALHPEDTPTVAPLGNTVSTTVETSHNPSQVS